MKAVGLKKEEKGVFLLNVPEPVITKPDEVKIRMLKAGICGSDRNLVQHHAVDAKEGEDFLVMGHEGFGVVTEVGKKVKKVKKRDFVVPTVRRSCGKCTSCAKGKSDVCYTGSYTEAGLHKLQGFFAEYAVAEEEYIAKVPKGLEAIAVWGEPMSIVAKTMEIVKYELGRYPPECGHLKHAYVGKDWGSCKTAIVLGAGPIGFLAACVLRAHGVQTEILLRHLDPASHREKLFRKIGVKYIRSTVNKKPSEWVDDKMRPSILIEAAGDSETAFQILPHLERNSVCVLTGVPRGGEKITCFDTDQLLRQMVRFNQSIVGSVNGNQGHFMQGFGEMKLIQKKFGNILLEAITQEYGWQEYETALTSRDTGLIKSIFNFK